MASLTLKNIRKVYDKTFLAVDDFNLEIEDKEFIVLVGPSGCGKSTVLRMVAGLEEITGGELYIGDRKVNYMEPKDRNIAMVFQNYALYPHMTVYQNIAFGLQMRKEPKKIIDEKVRAAAEILEISDLLKRKPKALSGGQRQRVAIGRAIVRNPDVFLMDEPLSNLDAKLRGQMRTELIKLRRRLNTTFIYVTHDQTEAMTLGDRIVIMNEGHIMQVGTPQEVFDRPENTFVAGFIGTPQMNLLRGSLAFENGAYFAVLGDNRVPLGSGSGSLAGREIILGVRPEDVSLSGDGGISAVSEVSELLGSTVAMHLRAGEYDIEAIVPKTEAETASGGVKGILQASVKLHFSQERLHLFDAETGKRIELN